MITAIVFCLFAPEIFFSSYAYRLRAVIHKDFPANYESIGYKESDGAVLDSVRTVALLPFVLNTDGLPEALVSKIKVLRVHRILFYVVALPVFAYVAVK